jgi:hypothetical protein
MNANLDRKVHALQVQVRRWKLLAVVFLLGLFLVPVYSQLPHNAFEDSSVKQLPAEKILAYDFTLLGGNGKPCARLFSKGNQAVMEFYGPNGDVIWSAPFPVEKTIPADVHSR